MTQYIQALVWDMDGTLVDSATVVPDAYVVTVEKHGGGTWSREQVVSLYSSGPPLVMLGRMLGRPASAAVLADFHRQLRLHADDVKVYPGVLTLLRQLQSRLPLAVFTGSSLTAAQILLSAAGLRQFFDAIVGGDEVAKPKPEPDGIIEAARRLGVDVGRTVYIGDAPSDVEAARRSGARPLAAGWGHLYTPGRDEPAQVAMEPAEILNLVPLKVSRGTRLGYVSPPR